MTIFQRTDRTPDKSAEADNAAKPAMRDTPAQPEPAPVIAPRPQSYAQPIAPVSTTAKPQSSTSSQGAPMSSVISKALKITGQLESSEDIQIDGQIDGDVRGVHVKIGNNAKVKGTVYGEEVEVAGTVEGKVEAKKVVLTATAHMSGDVVHQDIRIESGAFVDGHCKPEFGKTAAAKATVVTSPAASRPAAAE
jgi:cytoskeletal protein CcmA (bactofilin family)